MRRSEHTIMAAASLASAVALVVMGSASLPTAAPAPAAGGASAAAPAAALTRSAVLNNEEWLNSLRSDDAWRRRKSSAPASTAGQGGAGKPNGANPWGLFGGFDPALFPDFVPGNRLGGHGGTYRTVCVRLCDGFFFPISFATTRERFAADEATCASRCPSGARLFVYRNPGGEPEQMVDLAGRTYDKLKTAFLYRTAYDPSCKCKPHPWEQEARLQHRLYALEAERRRGNRRAVAEIRELKSAISKSTVAQQPAGGKPEPSTTSRPPLATATAPGGAAATMPEPLPEPLLTDAGVEPAKRRSKQRPSVAEGGKPLAKPMMLGGGTRSGPDGDWRRRALNNIQ